MDCGFQVSGPQVKTFLRRELKAEVFWDSGIGWGDSSQESVGAAGW